jgi:ABC-type sugar transport system permease subunit
MAQDAAMSPQSGAVKRESKWKSTWRDISKNRWPYIFISPFYILFIIFGAFPVLYSIYLSFHKFKGLGELEFVGFKNFTFLIGPGGKAFWQSIENGIILFLLYVPIMTFLALVLAVILNSKMVKFFQGYRMMIFAPYVTSMIAAGFVFRLMLENDGGLVNLILETLGVAGIPWLEHQWWARISLSLLIIWGWLGYNMVIMLAGLQTIPKELTEAALIDGASPTQAFFRITIPLMRPVILFSVILSTMGSFSLFNEVQALTLGGNPARATLTTLVHIYNVAFGDFRFGRASAQAYVYFALILVLTLLQFRYFGREEK